MKENSFDLENEYHRLVQYIKGMGSAVVAFSGGVDSSLLLAAAKDALGKRLVAVTGISPSVPERERQAARRIAAFLGVKHLEIESGEFENEDFLKNPPERCYFCKKSLFQRLKKIAEENHISAILEGSNADDRSDYRPGMRAVCELGVRSPLMELGLGKEQIRQLARFRELEVWDKPAAACLASRLPYGEKLAPERLRRIELAEDFLLSLGFSQVRVRDQRHLARIEVAREEMDRLLSSPLRERILDKLLALGFHYVTVDLGGYRRGSLNAPEEHR